MVSSDVKICVYDASGVRRRRKDPVLTDGGNPLAWVLRNYRVQAADFRQSLSDA